MFYLKMSHHLGIITLGTKTPMHEALEGRPHTNDTPLAHMKALNPQANLNHLRNHIRLPLQFIFFRTNALDAWVYTSVEYFTAPLALAVSTLVTLNPNPSSVWTPFIFFNLGFKTSLQEQLY